MVGATIESAATLYGNGSPEHKAVVRAWKTVGF
jgi:Zn-dependent metalloprotease